VDHENVSLGKRAHALAGQDAAQPRRYHEPGGSPHAAAREDLGRPSPVTPWGQPTRGFKTRNNKRTDKWIVTHKSKKR